eukprot:3301555-Prorocentrum_lima.AAC.1
MVERCVTPESSCKQQSEAAYLEIPCSCKERATNSVMATFCGSVQSCAPPMRRICCLEHCTALMPVLGCAEQQRAHRCL